MPNHGIGAEMYIMHDAVSLARLLNRTLVLPRIPLFETNVYSLGMNDYFEIPDHVKWISTEDWAAIRDDQIDLMFQVRPMWRHSYQSDRVRALHPIWFRNLEELTYFRVIGAHWDHVRQVNIPRPLSSAEASQMFSSDSPSIAVSFVNELVADWLPPECGLFPLEGRVGVPRRPIKRYMAEAQERCGGPADVAIHIRRGNLEQVLREVYGRTLPALEEYLQRVESDASRILIACDSRTVWEELSKMSPGRFLRIDCSDETVSTVLDIAACAIAGSFIGTAASTFSQYIGYVRYHLHGETEAGLYV